MYAEKLPHKINPDFNMAYFNNNNNLHQNTEKALWYIPLAEKIKEMLKKIKYTQFQYTSSTTIIPKNLRNSINHSELPNNINIQIKKHHCYQTWSTVQISKR